MATSGAADTLELYGRTGAKSGERHPTCLRLSDGNTTTFCRLERLSTRGRDCHGSVEPIQFNHCGGVVMRIQNITGLQKLGVAALALGLGVGIASAADKKGDHAEHLKQVE